MRRRSCILLCVLFLVWGTATAQEGGKFSLLVTPGINLPVGTPTEMFGFGAGAELLGICPVRRGRTAAEYRYFRHPLRSGIPGIL